MKNIFKSLLIAFASAVVSICAFAGEDEILIPYSMDLVACSSPGSSSGNGYITLQITSDLLAPYTKKEYFRLKYQGVGYGNKFCLEKLAPFIIEASLNNGYIKGKVNVGEKEVKHFVCTEHGSIYTGCKNGYYTYEIVEDIQVKFSSDLTMSASYI